MASWPFKLCPRKQKGRQRDGKEELVEFRREIFLKENRHSVKPSKEGARRGRYIAPCCTRALLTQAGALFV